MEYFDSDDLIRKLSTKNNVEASKNLTKFYVNARFKLPGEQFYKQLTDGSNDGGIDFYHIEDSTFYIFQTKFSNKSKRLSESDILHEINKIKNTISGQNPNVKADDFVNKIRINKDKEGATLEIIYLTTNIIKDNTRDEILNNITNWRKEIGWNLSIDFIVIDKYSLDSVIYDIKHGYVPYTGKKTLKLQDNQWLKIGGEDSSIESIICNVNVNQILNWFSSDYEIEKYLQKNVREFLGETSKINRQIKRSYLNYPSLFWYKHNGIIIFTDNLKIDKAHNEIILRNPQIVNGGQTIKSLFNAFFKKERYDNSANVLLRVYKLPYEHTETYKRSIDIISALNSQNKINPSDLRSTDPRQVKIEQLFEKFDYTYYRKRSKSNVAARYKIKMRDLALLYYACKKNNPIDAVRGQIEKLFEENSKYNYIFNEDAIFKELRNNHIIEKYILVWTLDQIFKKDVKKELAKKYKEYFRFVKMFVLVYLYNKTLEWKKRKFARGYKTWIKFIESEEFANTIFKYSKLAFKIGTTIYDKEEDPQNFYKSKKAVELFKRGAKKIRFKNLMNSAYKYFLEEFD